MGVVFEAENALTLKRIAIKWLHPKLATSEVARERLLREARATSRIHHRNVVDLYDVVFEDGAVLLIMQLLAGETLAQRLSRESILLSELMGLLLLAMEGSAAAHAVGVVHRDIKPENIFLARGEHGELIPKLIDFGISKTHDCDASRLTHSGMAIGTPRYVSFEQLRGTADVDGRSDVYAFGVILYETLLGRAPYRASSLAEQAVQFLTTSPRAPRLLRPELPTELDALVMRALARDPEARFASMDELIAALRPYTDPARYHAPLRTWKVCDMVVPRDAARADESTKPYSVVAAVDAPGPAARAPRNSSRVLWAVLCGALALCLLSADSLRWRPARDRVARASVASRGSLAQPARRSASESTLRSPASTTTPHGLVTAHAASEAPEPAVSRPPADVPRGVELPELPVRRKARSARSTVRAAQAKAAASPHELAAQLQRDDAADSGAPLPLAIPRAGHVQRDEF